MRKMLDDVSLQNLYCTCVLPEREGDITCIFWGFSKIMLNRWLTRESKVLRFTQLWITNIRYEDTYWQGLHRPKIYNEKEIFAELCKKVIFYLHNTSLKQIYFRLSVVRRGELNMLQFSTLNKVWNIASACKLEVF